jgi:hypothetical protein
VGSRSDDVGWLGAWGGGARRRRQGRAVADGGGSLGKMRKHAPGLISERGLHWKQEGDVRNTSKGLRRSAGDRRSRMIVLCGTAATARLRGCEKAGKRGKERQARILTTT